MVQPVVTEWDPMLVVNLPTSAIAINAGDLVAWESSTVTLIDAAAADNLVFLGVSGGKASATGGYVPVYPRCQVRIDMTSAAYTFGDGLLYTSKNTLAAATSGADQLAWFYDEPATTARAIAYIDIFCHLGVTGWATLEVPAA